MHENPRPFIKVECSVYVFCHKSTNSEQVSVHIGVMSTVMLPKSAKIRVILYSF